MNNKNCSIIQHCFMSIYLLEETYEYISKSIMQPIPLLLNCVAKETLWRLRLYCLHTKSISGIHVNIVVTNEALSILINNKSPHKNMFCLSYRAFRATNETLFCICVSFGDCVLIIGQLNTLVIFNIVSSNFV